MSVETRSRTTQPRKGAKKRILVCDELAPEAYDVFSERGYEAELCWELSPVELLSKVVGAHALVVRSGTRVDRALMEAAGTSLQVIGRAGVGVDNVDCEAATERGVVVMNAPGANTTTTAELAVALLCALARNIPQADRSVRAGSWKKKGLMGSELAGKTLGVIGMGRIGCVVAKRGQGLDLHVIAYDPYVGTGSGPVPNVELVELDELLERSDFVSLHVPMLDSTRHLLSRERIARMKPGARLINCARGGLIDEAALAEALESGHLRGAALDVFETEPPPADHPLLARADVIVTPHLGASSSEAQRNVAIDIARQICDFLSDGVAVSAVNAPAVSAETLREIGPYVTLAEKLGSFLAQTVPPPLRSLEVSVSGDIESKDTSHIALAILVGVLRSVLEGPVNFVNAPSLAAERGLRLIEVAEDETHFLHSQVKVRAFGRDTNHVVAGSVFGREPRLVRVDGTHLDMSLSGPLLITRHDDQPGVVGLLGTKLGQHGINIRRIELGPASDAKDALARGFLALYDEPPPAVVAELAELPLIRHVQLVHL